MRTIRARNLPWAWAQAAAFADAQLPPPQPTRAGPARTSPEPVATRYERPDERVLLDPVRDANPIFHLHEALWMLAGRDDGAYLDQYVGDFSARFAEPDGRVHGAYGRRWRSWFLDLEPVSGVARGTKDQLDEVVRVLRADPESRQAVVAMWDPEADLGVPDLRDRPCNTHLYLRVREVTTSVSTADYNDPDVRRGRVLDMTVCCRSNDVVWGCYGANAVHFSVLQEYLAARIGVGLGAMEQVSHNWHLYDATAHLVDPASAAEWARRPYPGTRRLVDDPERFDVELRKYLADPVSHHPRANGFLGDTARPMHLANEARRAGDWTAALAWADAVVAPDWREATVAWLERRRGAAERRGSVNAER